jgi:hypothetical protein
MKEVIIKLPVLGEVLICFYNLDKLADFTKRQFSLYIIDSNTRSETDSGLRRVEIKCNVKPDVNLNKNINFGNAWLMKGNDISFSEKSRSQGFSYTYTISDHVSFCCEYREYMGMRLKRLIQSPYAIMHLLFYKTVLYPLFGFYALFGNYFVTHGGLFSLHGRNILLSGLATVGKTTALEMLSENSTNIFSDNFTLYNGTYAIAFNLPARIKRTPSKQDNVIFHSSDFFEKYLSPIVSNIISVDDVILLTIGEEFGLEIMRDMPRETWILINNSAVEIAEANRFVTPLLYANSVVQNITQGRKEINFWCAIVPKGQISKFVGYLIDDELTH